MNKNAKSSQHVFLKPGQHQNLKSSVQYRLEKTDGVEGAGSAIFFNSKINLPIEKQQKCLPVYKYKESLLYLLDHYQTLVVLGETGCGKTTQIPQYLYHAGWAEKGYMIGVTQPRRIAAISVAQRVSDELNSPLGTVVGYAMRFEENFSLDKTKIKFVTDGHLIREMMYDPLLSSYSVIVLDEVHERSINTDVIMGLLKKILMKRPELRVIISSATMDPQKIAEFFDLSKSVKNTNRSTNKSTSYVLSIEGRMYPVEVFYLKSPTPDYVGCAFETSLRIHKQEKSGDILVFLTGQDQIEQAVSLMTEKCETKSVTNEAILPLPMYSSLSIQEQLKVFQPAPVGKRKIIFSTNIAETSVTIPNIVYIVDCGFSKMTFYDCDKKINMLITAAISKDSADQRSGRAGRVRPGKAYRLYTEEYYNRLNNSSIPEIQRCDMAPVILLLKSLGIDKILTFGFVSAPSAKLMASGLQILYSLNIGINVAEFPLEPIISKMLLTSAEFGCSEEIVTIAAMLQLENIYYIIPNRKREAEKARMRFAVKQGDHLTYINIYRAFISKNKDQQWCKRNYINYKAMLHAHQIRSSLIKLLKKYNIPIISCEDDDVAVRRCLTAGFFSCVAKYTPNGEYRTLSSDTPLHIHPLSVLCYDVPPPWIIYNQVITSNKDYMRDVTVIDPLWLVELALHYYHYGTDREIAAKKSAANSII